MNVDGYGSDGDVKLFDVSLIAFDALPGPGDQQYTQPYIDRELKKAYVSFRQDAMTTTTDFRKAKPLRDVRRRAKPLCTGNWGCGMFGGDVQLKSLIQWVACSF